MGQGSRGGKDGVSSSGTRQRSDKALLRNRRNPRFVGSSSESKSSSSSSSNSRGRRGLGFPNGFPGGGFGLPNLGSGSSGSGGRSGKQKTTKPPAAEKQNKMKKITRIKPVRVRLTKQRTNKTPN